MMIRSIALCILSGITDALLESSLLRETIEVQADGTVSEAYTNMELVTHSTDLSKSNLVYDDYYYSEYYYDSTTLGASDVEDPSTYEDHLNKNCYSRHGGEEIDSNDVALSRGRKTVEECKDLCTEDPICSCVTHSRSRGLCWKRKNCKVAQMPFGDDEYDTYVKKDQPSPPPTTPVKASTGWQGLLEDSSKCPAKSDDGITCKKEGGVRHFKFPAGKFHVDQQVWVAEGTTIEGNANPNPNGINAQKPDQADQTVFIATDGVTDGNTPYCKADLSSVRKWRKGFLLHSNTAVKNINFQGADVTRTGDNGYLCGGGAFETPGCVGANDCESVDLGHTKGGGVENVTIDNVRLNDYYDRGDPPFTSAKASVIAVWVAMTRDGSETKNVHVTNLVSMLQKGDGMNYHGNVTDCSFKNSHIENTGDDIFALWGGKTGGGAGVVFENLVGKNPGVARHGQPYGYGVCVAVYGAKEVTFRNLTCYDVKWKYPEFFTWARWIKDSYHNSALANIWDSFAAVYPPGASITFDNNKYLWMNDSKPITDRPKYADRTGGSFFSGFGDGKSEGRFVRRS